MPAIRATSSSTQPQLHRLLEANRLAVEHLDLTLALRQIVEAAVELVGSAYGAIGVLGPSGRLEQFIHTGMDAATVTAIGPTPDGLGLLGALIKDPRPVRLAVLSDDPRSVGVPLHHPPISSFLGVPLEVRDEIFGHLYLADPRVGAYTADDQVLVEALATTAGVAIAHARLFEESTRREQWTAATTEITHELLTNDEVDALQLVADRVLDLAGASLVMVVLAHDSQLPDAELVVDRAAGARAGEMLGTCLPEGDNLVRRSLATHRPQLAESLPEGRPVAGLGPAMAVPLLADGGARGSLLVLRDEGSPLFTEFDLDVAASLAGHAALALDRTDAREARLHLRTLRDRDRIARDLHDHVVQRLFAAGLTIQSVCSALGPGPVSDRLSGQVDEIDATIRQIRTTIFALNTGGVRGLRSQVLAVASATTVLLPGPPEVTFAGPIDLLVPEAMHPDVCAVVREALTNVGRHAQAHRAEVRVSATPAELAIEVLDDGRGMPGDVVLSGLDNLRARAAALGGAFELTEREGPGTRLLWRVPLAEAT
jgi:signal transduction histidine kinase